MVKKPTVSSNEKRVVFLREPSAHASGPQEQRWLFWSREPVVEENKLISWLYVLFACPWLLIALERRYCADAQVLRNTGRRTLRVVVRGVYVNEKEGRPPRLPSFVHWASPRVFQRVAMAHDAVTLVVGGKLRGAVRYKPTTDHAR